jgi:hypothetical protein
MQIHLSPIVGSFFRPPAKTILGLLQAGHDLILDPEPDNQYDPNAIRVCVRLNSIEVPADEMDAIEDELMKYGATWADLSKDDFGKPVDDPIFHLGYVPRSGAKTAKIDGLESIGNLEVLEVLKNPNHRATFTFSPGGQPLAQIVEDSVFAGDPEQAIHQFR